jgi:hypothetical protein
MRLSHQSIDHSIRFYTIQAEKSRYRAQKKLEGNTLIPNDLDQHSLPASAVEFAVEDPLPRAKVQTAVGHRNDDFAAHDPPLQMSIGMVLPRRCGCKGFGWSACAVPALQAISRIRM